MAHASAGSPSLDRVARASMLMRMKSRVTVSLPADVVDEADRLGKRNGIASRSALVEAAVRLLVRRLRAQELESSLDAYYGSRTEADKRDDEAIVTASARRARTIDLDEEPRPRPGKRRR